jgi:hypothetical protein
MGNLKLTDLLPEKECKKIFKMFKNNARDIIFEDINDARTCIDSIKLGSGNKKRLIRLIGDELADRGANDYLTLLLLGKMKDLELKYEIIWSNHGNFFYQYHT